MVVYADTSALFKHYVEEPDSDIVRRILDQSRSLITSALTELEITSAFERAKRDRRINSPFYRTITQAFERDLREETIGLIELSSIIMAEAKRIIKHHRLRPPDAIQVASLKQAAKNIPQTEFFCFDKAVSEAAKFEGLKCIDF